MIIGRVLLTAAAFLFTAVSGSADVIPDGPHIYVEGSAAVDVVPDRIEMTVVISAIDKDVALAKADVDKRSIDLIKVCESIGVATSDLSSTELGVGASYRYENGERTFEGTRVDRTVRVNLRDLSRYSDLTRAVIDAKIAEVLSVSLHSEAADEAADNALLAALEDATQRARRLAEASGGKLGDVYSISEFQVRRTSHYDLYTARTTSSNIGPRQPAMREAPQEVFTPGLIKASAQAYVVFKLKP